MVTRLSQSLHNIPLYLSKHSEIAIMLYLFTYKGLFLSLCGLLVGINYND